ncbi:MAG: hypothetical protein J6L89_07500 [Clostridia bacterium]|nr:hypothetical protein [Clostridia bacterium]
MRYINAIIKILTFPGSLLKGFWEQLLCKFFGVPVENKKYLQFNEMAGHVEHEPVSGNKSFWFCFVSGFMVFITGLIFAVPAFLNICFLDVTSSTLKIVSLICLYMAVAMFTNLFPSIEDALMMWEKYKEMGKSAKIIFAPGAAIMYVGAYAENMGITFLTNAALAAAMLLL